MVITLAHLDWAVIGVFVALVLALGLSVRSGKEPLEYLAAGRALSLPAFVATLVATWYGGILGVGESVSYYGVGAWLLIGVPYYVFGIGYALWLAPRVREANQISIPERIRVNVGDSSGTLAASLLFLLAIPAAHVLMLGTLVQAVTGWSTVVSVLVGTGIGAAFIFRGGLLADVRVSMFSFLMMYVGFAVVLVFCWNQVPLTGAIQDLTAHGYPGELQTLTGGQGWPAIVSFFILGAWTLADPGFHQRVAASSNPHIGRKGVLWAVACWVLFDLLSISTAIYGMTLVGDAPANPLLIYPALAESVLPPGAKAIFLVGMAGTILSAAVGYALISGASIGREILAQIRPGQSEVAASRWGIGIAMIVALAVALTLNSVVAIWYTWAGLVIGAVLLPTLIAYFSQRRWDSRSITLSMAASFTFAGAWMIYGLVNGNPFLEVDWGFGRFSL
ncbi:MAG: hypothetical protein KF812_12460, partial [Fimbriimonadaceae bacterium]|nr:hypothetical protein [Fimbriimonadaceae bacterium]